LKKQYQGSEEEVEDIKKAYIDTHGSIGGIMNHIPHSEYDDEARFIVLISDLIRKGELPSLPTWESGVEDEKAKLVRKKQSQKEAKQAEELAKELGIWEEFYGSGKPSVRKGKGRDKGKGKKQDEEDDEEEDHSALQALILKKKKNMDGFLDSLAAKYAEPQTRGKKGKKRNKAPDVDEDDADAEPPKKKAKRGVVEPPDIEDEEFERLQQTLFADHPKSAGASTKAKKGRAGAGKRSK